MNKLLASGDKTKSRTQRVVPNSLCMINMLHWKEVGHTHPVSLRVRPQSQRQKSKTMKRMGCTLIVGVT